MLDFELLNLGDMVIHKVGNKLRQEGLLLSKGLSDISDQDTRGLVLKYFLRPFRNVDTLYHFSHPASIQLNEMYSYASTIFSNPNSFYDQSVHAARHLYENSLHPRIKGGEFYFVYLKSCKVNGIETDAIGVFKTENKETYLKVINNNNNLEISYDQGIDINKLDKGCIIFNIDAISGFQVCIVDTHSKGSGEAQYWKDDFLQLEPIQNDHIHTESFIELCSQYAQETSKKENDKTIGIQWQTKALRFLSENDTFDIHSFSTAVFNDTQEVESFNKFKSQFEENQSYKTMDTFSITPKSIAKMKRRLRNFIQLDTDIDITIRNASEETFDFVERGYDSSKNMHFYKVYFNEEK